MVVAARRSRFLGSLGNATAVKMLSKRTSTFNGWDEEGVTPNKRIIKLHETQSVVVTLYAIKRTFDRGHPIVSPERAIADHLRKIHRNSWLQAAGHQVESDES